MNDKSDLHELTSTGQKMVEPDWLDIHFQAALPEYEAMIRASGIQSGWKVLDAGVGSGSFLKLLAQLVGRHGEISALDHAPENIAFVQALLDSETFACPVAVRLGSVCELPYADDSFDAAWCANTVQYLSMEEMESALREFARVVKPGGLVAVKEFDNTGLYFGPFDPALIWHMLDALRDSPHIKGAGALFSSNLRQYFAQAGFSDIRLRTFTGDYQPPFSPVQKMFLQSALQLYSSLAERAELPTGELDMWRRQIGNPLGQEYILDRPDFYFRETHVLTTGIVP